jgi:cytochrome bd-type quinol oxidase subunit 1
MRSRLVRVAILVLGAAALFAGVVLICWHLMPEPHSQTDLLVIGCIATFFSLGAVFIVLIATWMKSPDNFYKRRPRPGESDE